MALLAINKMLQAVKQRNEQLAEEMAKHKVLSEAALHTFIDNIIQKRLKLVYATETQSAAKISHSTSISSSDVSATFSNLIDMVKECGNSIDLLFVDTGLIHFTGAMPERKKNASKLMEVTKRMATGTVRIFNLFYFIIPHTI